MENIKTVSIVIENGGYPFKEDVIANLKGMGFEVIDCGTFSKESCNYPEQAFKAATAVSEGKAQAGVLICSSGEGVCICANKVKGVICGLAYNDDVSHLMVAHNHANMIAFGQKIIGDGLMLEIVDTFLHTEFEGGRHQRRVDKISAIEEKYSH